MPVNTKIDLTNEEKEQLKDLLTTAKLMLDGVTKAMPETQAVVEQFPGINPVGYYSEIDMGFAERMKRCENASRMRDPLAWEVYQDVKEKIEATPVYAKMKKEMKEVSKKIRVIDRAIRMCDDEKLMEALEEQREGLKNAPVLKEYDKYLNVMEHYSGVKFFNVVEQRTEQFEMYTYLKENFGVKSITEMHYDIHDQVLKFSNPKNLEIEFANFDDIVTYQRMVEDKNLGKTWEEVQAEPVEPSEIKEYVSAMPEYVQASCDRVLDSALPIVKDRADMIFINGVSVRDMMKKEDEFKEKEPTDEQIKKYSSLYVAAALRNGSYVEAFTKSLKEGKNINYKPVPITVKGENSYILKKGGANEIENITVGFLDRFLAKLGFTYFKEKLKAAEIAVKVKISREAFRAAHREEMKLPMNKAQMEEKKQAYEAIHKYKDRFFEVCENNMNFTILQTTLDQQFFPNGKKDVVNKATGTKVPNDRERVRTLVVAKMIKAGFSLDQILDTSKYVEERAQFAEELVNELENCDEKAFYEMHFDSQKLLKTAIEDYAQEHEISFKKPETVFGDPAVALLDLATGAGNITDFMLGADHKKKVEGMFGKEALEAADQASRNSMVIAMVPKFVGKKAAVFESLANGLLPNSPQSDVFTDAIKAEVIMGVFGAMEEYGDVYSPNLDAIQVESIYQMVLAHPNVEKFYKKSSVEQLTNIVTKGNILKELKVDFEILPEKMMPGKKLESKVFDVTVEMGDPMAEVIVVPTFDGSSDYYEMDDPATVMAKADEMEANMEADMEM